MRSIAALLAGALTACGGPEPVRDTAETPAVDTAVARPDSVARTAGNRGAVLFLGTSLTAGYGVGEALAFPALLQQKIDSAGLPYEVVNAGLSGETSAGGVRRIEWSLQDSIAVLVLELGANDGLRGLPVAELRANLDSIMSLTRTRYPHAHIVLAGMEAPPNLGARYTDDFRNTYRDLADEHDATLVPFLLLDVAGVPALNQDDGIHPNARGHERIAETLWPALRGVLQNDAR